MRQVTIAAGEREVLSGQWWAVRALGNDDNPGASLELDGAAPIPVYGAYTIPAHPARPFFRVAVTGPLTVQLAEEPGERLPTPLVVNGGRRRAQASTELVPAGADYQSALLHPAGDRGVVFMVETGGAPLASHSFYPQAYSDDGSTLLWEGVNLDVLPNSRAMMILTGQSEKHNPLLATLMGTRTGVYDGWNAPGTGYGSRGWPMPPCTVMGFRSPGAGMPSMRVKVWL